MSQDEDDDDEIIAKKSKNEKCVSLKQLFVCKMGLLVLMSTSYNSKVKN